MAKKQIKKGHCAHLTVNIIWLGDVVAIRAHKMYEYASFIPIGFLFLYQSEQHRTILKSLVFKINREHNSNMHACSICTPIYVEIIGAQLLI